jgi:uracil-DNA glycosylase
MSEVSKKSVQIEAGWGEVLKDQFDLPYFFGIKEVLLQAKEAGKVVFPPGSLIFNAFTLTPWDEVKVVILGQDPYHNPGEAMGLSFSVPRGVRVPPSLRTIYREMVNDVYAPMAGHGDLTAWAKQGVLLLNAMLTVEQNLAGSHQKIGWQQFTDAVITVLSQEKEGLVFLLWGRFAQSKAHLIDTTKHCILEAAHPSPLARDAFMGCKHFSKTNAYLASKGAQEINWDLVG